MKGAGTNALDTDGVFREGSARWVGGEGREWADSVKLGGPGTELARNCHPTVALGSRTAQT